MLTCHDSVVQVTSITEELRRVNVQSKARKGSEAIGRSRRNEQVAAKKIPGDPSAGIKKMKVAADEAKAFLDQCYT